MQQSEELREEQACFRPGKGTRDMLVIVQILIKKVNRLSAGKLYLFFIDYTKAFDTVSHPLLFTTLMAMGLHVIWWQ